MKKRLMILVFMMSVTLIIQPPAPVSAGYPERPVTILAGFKAGGNVDAVARILAKAAGKILGQPMVVENKPGAGGGVAAATLKNAKPDGYTLCLNMATAFTVNPLLGKSVYGMDDFIYIAASGKAQEGYVSNPSKEWKDWKGMIQKAKASEGLIYASMMPLDKTFAKVIAQKEGVKLTAVPTKGGAEVITSVLGNHVDFGFSGGLHYSYAKAGQMVVLATLGKERQPDFPDAPTLNELGYGIIFDNYVVIAAPKGISADVIEKLSKAFSEAIQDPEYVDLMNNKIHWIPLYLGSNALTDALTTMSESYRKMIEEQK